MTSFRLEGTMEFRVNRARGTKLRAAFEEIKMNACILSHDPKTQVGAAIVCPDSFRVLATSTNGFIAGAADKVLPNLSPWKHDYMRHAERNLIGFCARKGIKMEGKIVVVTHSPCYECSRALWDAGVSKIIFETEHKMTKEKFKDKMDLSYKICKLKDYHIVENKLFSNDDNDNYSVMLLTTRSPMEVHAMLRKLERKHRMMEECIKIVTEHTRGTNEIHE